MRCRLFSLAVLAILFLASTALAAPLDLATEVAELYGSDTGAGDYFGSTVALSGTTLAVHGYDAGAVYIYEGNPADPGQWVETAVIPVPDLGIFFDHGDYLALDGDTLVVGVPGLNPAAGSVLIYERNLGGPDQWGLAATVTASDGDAADRFGFAVDLDSDTLVVGAYDDEGGGSACVFERNLGGGGNWGEVGKLIGSDTADFDRFGFSVSVDGDTIAVGAPANTDYGFNTGSVYLFERNLGGAESWGESKKLLTTEVRLQNELGYHVVLSGDTLAVASERQVNPRYTNHSVYIFERDFGGAENWGEVTEILSPATGPFGPITDEMFATSIDLDGDLLVVGAPAPGNPGFYTGEAWVFGRNVGGPEAWGLVSRLLPADAEARDRIGNSVAVSGSLFAVGAPSEDDRGLESGSVYIFSLQSGACVSSPLGTAGEGFSLFILGDIDHRYTDAWGRVAGGGDVTLTSYGVASHLSGFTGDALVVGGNLTWSWGQVYSGDVVYGGSDLTLVGVNVLNGVVEQGAPIDFAAEGAWLGFVSTLWSNLPANGVTDLVTWDQGQTWQITLTGTDPEVNVFTLPGDRLSHANGVTIHAPAGSTVLINISGTENRMQNFGFFLDGVSRDHVLFNFYETQALTLQSVGVQGTVLAPGAAVTHNWAVIEQALIAASLDGSGEVHNGGFGGCLPLPLP